MYSFVKSFFHTCIIKHWKLFNSGGSFYYQILTSRKKIHVLYAPCSPSDKIIYSIHVFDLCIPLERVITGNLVVHV